MDVNIAELFGATTKKRDKSAEFAAILSLLAKLMAADDSDEEAEDESMIVGERAREIRVRPRVEPLGG